LEALLEFAKGPLFRFSLAIMILGLGRVIILSILGIVKSYRQAGNKAIPTRAIIQNTLGWFLPYRRVIRVRPIFSVISVLFHIGLLVTPLFLFAHIALWRQGVGFGWPALPKLAADILTIVTVATALWLIGFKVFDNTARGLSRAGDYLWVVLLALPFIAGFLCVHSTLNPLSYKAMLLVHVLSAELILVLIPFTKIAHCVLVPFTQLISDLGWRFPADMGEKVRATLDKKGAAQ